jgi:YesN/AraC family two-component response regulator
MKKENDAEKLASFIRLLIILADDKEQLVAGHNHKIDAKECLLNLIRSYVICNFYKSITIDDIARYVNMNRTSFCRFFKHNMGISFINYLRWVLIIIFFEILIPPEPFMRDAPHFFYRKYNKNLL